MGSGHRRLHYTPMKTRARAATTAITTLAIAGLSCRPPPAITAEGSGLWDWGEEAGTLQVDLTVPADAVSRRAEHELRVSVSVAGGGYETYFDAGCDGGFEEIYSFSDTSPCERDAICEWSLCIELEPIEGVVFAPHEVEVYAQVSNSRDLREDEPFPIEIAFDFQPWDE